MREKPNLFEFFRMPRTRNLFRLACSRKRPFRPIKPKTLSTITIFYAKTVITTTFIGKDLEKETRVFAEKRVILQQENKKL
jgi:hypothetical protein